MPRPLNWIRGEGTVKNQRWGLGSMMDTPFVVPGMGDITVGSGVMTNPDPLAGLTSDWYDLLANLGGPNASAVSGSGQTIFTTSTGGTNWVTVGLLAIGGYLLLRR